jgi:hypothetical protein
MVCRQVVRGRVYRAASPVPDTTSVRHFIPMCLLFRTSLLIPRFAFTRRAVPGVRILGLVDLAFAVIAPD